MARRNTGRGARASAAAVPERCVVYVHGICKHDAGYSDGWWEALRPHLGDWPDGGRREVLWSDLINAREEGLAMMRLEAMSRAATALWAPAPAEAAAGPVTQVRDILADRAARDAAEAALQTSFAGPALAEARVRPLPMTRGAVTAEAFLGIPGLDCIDDFGRYLTNDGTRQQVIDRFIGVARPLLAGGARVEVIAHSWGTVVAYEALCQMEAESLPGSVHTLFTVGSALSIAPVRRRLLVTDGHRPRNVGAWVNLDARFDVVGGPLQGVPFEVDYEYLNLAPVGCSMIIPRPSCAHGSYFHPDNLAVNREIFGRHIGA